MPSLTTAIRSVRHLLQSQSTIFGKLRRQFEILWSSQSYGLVRWTNPPPGHARATRGRRFARGGGPVSPQGGLAAMFSLE
jgi:hypothetical protein